jgi:hypothetical protein
MKPKRTPTRTEAFVFQAHLIQYLLNDAVIPVVRSEVLCNLQMDVSLKYEEARDQYSIKVSLHNNTCATFVFRWKVIGFWRPRVVCP